MFIHTNLAAMNAQRHVNGTNGALDRSIERLASGLRINSGADDASGLAISEKMAAQVAGLATANENAQDGRALFKIAEGGLAQVSAMLTRMEELAVRATNGTLTASDRAAILDEVDELRDQIGLIARTTEYNTLKLLNGSLAIDAELSNGALVRQGSVRVIEKPGTLRNGSAVFVLTQQATPALLSAANPAVAASVNGTININGIDVAFAAGDGIEAMVAKINEANERTGVIAVIDPALGGFLDLVTGDLDTDAMNVDTTLTGIVGYAVTGSSTRIELSGNAALLADMGHVVLNTRGTDAGGTLNGVAMTAVGGTVLRDDQQGSDTYGLVLDTEIYNGGRGALIRTNVALGAETRHQSYVGDTITVTTRVDDRLRLQLGANYDQSIYFGLDSFEAGQLGIGGSSKFGSLSEVKFDTSDHANLSLKVVRKAIEDVSGRRSAIGAVMNRLDYTIRTLGVQRENMTGALSRIQDADLSAEMTSFTRGQIVLQAGTAMLAQANARPLAAVRLLQ